jgi:acyl-coenzyme A thioesterase PaaI-like protein
MQTRESIRVPFSTVSKIAQESGSAEGEFTADIHPEWTVGGKPNGGYLLAMMARAATTVAPHDYVTAASAHFLHSPNPGPAAITAEVLRAGRSASQVRCRLLQDGKACVEALTMVSSLDPDAVPFWDKGVPKPSTASFEESVRLNPDLEFPVAIMHQVEVRLDPEFAAFTRGEASGRGELQGWLSLPEDESFDPYSLLYAVDSYPPATLDIQRSGWVPSLELTIYVRALPAPGPVRVLQKAMLIEAQRVDETCFVWDSRGRLVAQATQLAGIRLG